MNDWRTWLIVGGAALFGWKVWRSAKSAAEALKQRQEDTAERVWM